MKRAWTWLRAPGWWTVPRWRWLVTAACVALGVAVWLSGYRVLGVLLGILGGPTARSRVPATEPAPDPGPAAQDAHRAAVEVDRARQGVEAESRAREAAGARAASEDDIADVRRRVEERARRGR